MAEILPGQVFHSGTEEMFADAVKGDSNKLTSTTPLTKNVEQWFNEQNGQTLTGALAFVPFILQQSYIENDLKEELVIHRGRGGVVFSDASGFTALTEKLAQKSNGAELLSQCLAAFFTPLIDLINAYRGDTIKFSGDALTIYFPEVDDTKCAAYNVILPPHGSFRLKDLGPMATAVLRASACCIEIHKRLHMFETGVDGVKLCLHIGVGCGEISILEVGGVVPPETHVPRMEYLISGSPLEQISVAEPLAKNGETCLSPQAWELVKDCVIQGRALEDRPEFRILERMDESKYTFPTIKYATQLYDTRHEKAFRIEHLDIIRRYIPSSVFKQIECGTLPYVNEMRKISVVFINGQGLDLMSSDGPKKAQELMSSVQKVCYAHEGTLNKFLIDDKGMLFLLVFGLPPLVHPDDPTRAVLACMDLGEVFKRMELGGRFGVTTGRSYCGVCGSAKRMEYTVLGDSVNLSARLMSNAQPLSILTDEETSRYSTGEIEFKALPHISVKGKSNQIPIFKPVPREAATYVGLTPERTIRFPWYDTPMDGSIVIASDVVAASKERVQQLCSVSKWAPMAKVSDMLGGAFNRSIHLQDQLPSSSAPRLRAPPASPFAEGGIVVIEGANGLGKIELAEHIVTYCSTHFHMMPIFGTMGPRPGESTRMATELLRSTVGVFRYLDPTLPRDDMQALEKVLPPQCGNSISTLHALLRIGRFVHGDGTDVFKTAVKVVIALLTILKKQTPVLVVLLFETGTSLFPKTIEQDQQIFWDMTADLTKLVQTEKQIAGLILCNKAPLDKSKEAAGGSRAGRKPPAVQNAIENGSHLVLKGLTEENTLEYMSNYLNIPDHAVPMQLRRFVVQVTLGNPLHIRETLDQLLKEQHLKVKPGVSATVAASGLDRIDIASWNHTQMVGGTICQLESLDPIEAATLKMSTCFEGPFTLPDLAATNCSQWGGATHFDLLRLFRAIRKLISMGIIEEIQQPTGAESNKQLNPPSPRVTETTLVREQFGKMQYFQMKNALVRTVGAAMVLEAQKKSVKRNALIDRVLKSDLPERMKELQQKKSVQHIPWYYERALRRMM